MNQEKFNKLCENYECIPSGDSYVEYEIEYNGESIGYLQNDTYSWGGYIKGVEDEDYELFELMVEFVNMWHERV